MSPLHVLAKKNHPVLDRKATEAAGVEQNLQNCELGQALSLYKSIIPPWPSSGDKQKTASRDPSCPLGPNAASALSAPAVRTLTDRGLLACGSSGRRQAGAAQHYIAELPGSESGPLCWFPKRSETSCCWGPRAWSPTPRLY